MEYLLISRPAIQAPRIFYAEGHTINRCVTTLIGLSWGIASQVSLGH